MVRLFLSYSISILFWVCVFNWWFTFMTQLLHVVIRRIYLSQDDILIIIVKKIFGQIVVFPRCLVTRSTSSIVFTQRTRKLLLDQGNSLSDLERCSLARKLKTSQLSDMFFWITYKVIAMIRLDFSFLCALFVNFLAVCTVVHILHYI